MADEAQTAQESISHFTGFITNDLPVLRDSIDKQVQDREESDDETLTLLHEHISKLNTTLLNERSARET